MKYDTQIQRRKMIHHPIFKESIKIRDRNDSDPDLAELQTLKITKISAKPSAWKIGKVFQLFYILLAHQ